MALNELRPGLEYKLLEQSGPVHMPTFKIAIDLDGQIFTGEGRYVSEKILHFNFDLKKTFRNASGNPSKKWEENDDSLLIDLFLRLFL